MFASNAVRRLLAAVALVAIFLMAVPAYAADGRAADGWDGVRGLFDRLITWIVGINMAGGSGNSHGHEGGYVDPNGRPGSCELPDCVPEQGAG